MLGAQASPYRRSGDLVVSCGFRYFESHRHFVGDEEQHERAEEGSEVINNVGLADLELAYHLDDRWSIAAALPYQVAERSQAIRDFDGQVVARNRTSTRGIGDASIAVRAWALCPRTYRRANLLVGAGLKLPTGRPNLTDNFRSFTGTTEVRTADQSIQPGDGGVGIVLSAQAFAAVSRFTLYFAGTYLANPRGNNGVPTYRSRASEAFMSVADQYVARAGAFTAVPLPGAAAGLGLRIEGTPVRDVLGDSEGFRRPGYSFAIEPALAFGRGAWAFSASVPIALYRNRTRSVPDQMQEGRHGDAAFADYAILVGFSYARPASRSARRATTTPVIDASLTTLDGAPVRLRDRLGAKLTVLNLWASWCEPCRAEIPLLVRMRGEIEARGGALVGVAVDEDAADSRRFLADLGGDFPSLYGGPELASAIGEDRVPTTLILDADGAVLVRLTGELDEAALRGALDRATR